MKCYPLYEAEQLNNLRELLGYTARKYGDKAAFSYEKDGKAVSVSYRQFKSDVEALGAALADMGLRNVKAALIGENSYEWILTYFAVVNSGNVIVPLDRELPAPDVMKLTRDAQPEAFIYSSGCADTASYLRETGGGIRHYIHMSELSRMTEKGRQLIPQEAAERALDDRALAVLLYTSGTTGHPKGVMLSHFNLTRDAVGCCRNVRVRGRNLLVLPLHHSFGLTACVLYMMLSGSEIVINKSLKNIMKDFVRYQPYNVFLVPLFMETFYKRIWTMAKGHGKEGTLKTLLAISGALLKIGIDARRLLFKSVLRPFGGRLELIVTGGAPIDDKIVQGLQNFGITTLNGYGITECAPVVSVNRNGCYRNGSIGLVLPCCEVRISEPDSGGYGEIYVRGENVMLGYYQDDQATKEAFDGEWFKTGDIGRLDKDGFVYISGRKNNLIILSNGKNVCSEELESALLGIPYILEAVVYAQDNMIAAEIYLNPNSEPDCASCLNSDIDKLNQSLPQYKKIDRITIRKTEFPKTTTKKIERRQRGE
jgi:long-chain acyl-CoA synthetase